MPRIRSLKPSFWGDDDVARLSRDARLLLIGLISMADDDGRFLGSVSAITGYIYPHDELPPAKVKSWLAEIEQKAIKTVRFYEVDGFRYGCFPKYRSHQVINKPQPSPLPPPPSNGTTP